MLDLELGITNGIAAGDLDVLRNAGLVSRDEENEILASVGVIDAPAPAAGPVPNGRPRKRRANNAPELGGHPLDGE